MTANRKTSNIPALATDKIQPTDKLGEMADIDITLAKNEWENFQIVVASIKKDEAVTVAVSDFVNADGDTFPVDIYKEHYSENTFIEYEYC